MSSILIAGIGNIFFGDDGFGVAVAQRLARCPLPENIRVADFGIRGIDLAFALLDGYDMTILVDAIRRDGLPGTLYIMEPDLTNLNAEDGPCTSLDGHRLDPLSVLNAAKQMGADFGRVLLLGCEPVNVGDEENAGIGLTPAVEAAIEPAIEMILSLIHVAPGERSLEREECLR